MKRLSNARVPRAVLLLLFSSASLLAVQPQFWRVTTPEDFLAGEIEGMAVTSSGELRPGPQLTKLVTFTEPFVLSQTTDGAGTRYFGTGNDGKVYQFKGSERTLAYTAAEPEIYALAFANGALYVGSSPHGKVYRVNPVDGTAVELFDPKQAYIWAITPLADGVLAVATGVEGKLFRVDGEGKGAVWFDAPESHLRSVAALPNGKLLVGGSGEGRIYEITTDGSGRALYDSQLPEISSIYFDSKRNVSWAAGVANVAPQAPPPPKQEPPKPASGSTTSSTSGEARRAEPSASIDVSFSFAEPASATSVGGGSSELYRIEPDGYVEVVRKFDREMIYSIAGGPEDAIYLSTGPLGRVYQLRGNEIALIANVPEKQVVSFSNDPSAILITTTNSGAAYRLSRGVSDQSEFRSPIKDTGRFSTFGSFRVEGSNLPRHGMTVSFRSGNTATPDETWSRWYAVNGTHGKIEAPQARYVQWKVGLKDPAVNVSLDSVTVAYINRNAPPVIENVSVNDPGVIFVTGNYSASPQVLEATNPDEYGIFTGLETPREKNDPGKKLFRKGYRTIDWKASDPNGDSLRHAVHFRRKNESSWLKLRENLEETQVNFDTSQLPDGVYEVKVTSSDAPDNPEAPKTDTKEGTEFTVDNSPPVIQISSRGDGVNITIRDALSPIGKVEYSIDAEKWIRLLPIDGIADSSEEQFSLKRTEAENHFVVIRAVDAFANVATASVRVP